MGTPARVVVLPVESSVLRVEDVILPDPGPTQVVIKQFASGVCHSQLHQMHRPRKNPVILGHEATGVVLKAGAKVTHVKEGDVVTVNGYRLECVETPGHTWGHVCLYEPERKVFFSGDHILGDITPNIQAWVGDEDPLAAYIQSLSKIEAMEVSMVLPGHRSLIPNSRKRIRGLKQHHLARCNEVLDILRGGAQSAYQTAAQMTWDIRADRWEDFPLMQKWFATGEAIAHLRFLENRGLTEKKLNPQGVFLYTLTNEDARLETVD